MIDGEVHWFPSALEARRYDELCIDPDVTDLELQPSYLLIPPQKWENGRKDRGVRYIADFRYKRNGAEVVEDAKGVETKELKIKVKLMKMVYGIEVSTWTGR